MTNLLPDREYAQKMGWTHQVQWFENGNPCFVRCKSGAEADDKASSLRRTGADVAVVDLRDALQIH